MSVVLDASALLAYMNGEVGAQRVRAVIGEAMISAVNWSEVIGKAADRGVDTVGLREDLGALGLVVEPFTAEQAEIAGHIKDQTRQYVLSLGDRACLALGIDRRWTVFTADQVWLELRLQIDVISIR